MKIVYGVPTSPGWAPITHMVRLLSSLLEAELVLIPVSRTGNALRRLISLAPRRRGRETCLVIAADPRQLLAVLGPGGWMSGFQQVAGWVIESPWLERIPRSLRGRRFGHFDQLFITDKELTDAWATVTGVPVTWLPMGSDVLRLGSGNADRPVDLQRVGRQPPDWEDDAASLKECEAAGIRFEGRPPMHRDATTNQASLMSALSRAKFTLAFSNTSAPASYTHPTQDYLTGRWTDALASGAVVAGVAPKCATATALLWQGATLELETTDRARGIEQIASAISEWTPKLARTNHREALRRLDWRWRFRDLTTAMGIGGAEHLEAELATIQQLLSHSRVHRP